MSEANMQRMQELGAQLQSIQQYMQMLEEQTQEVSIALESIDDIQTIKKGTPIFAPLSNGVFVEAHISDSKKFLVNVGNNVIAAKSSVELKKMLSEQQLELKNAQEKVVEQFTHMYQEYFQLQMGQ